VHQAGVGWPKAAGLAVERAEPRLEVDVQPLAAGFGGVYDRVPHEPATDSSVLLAATRLRVQEERMIPSVPGDVDEPDQARPGPGR